MRPRRWWSPSKRVESGRESAWLSLSKPAREVSPSSTIQSRRSSDAVVFQAAALCLNYPESDLLDRVDVIEAALAGTEAAESFAPVMAHLRGENLRELQSFHVQEFDLSRKHALHLSYWTEGDTRRRGNVLAEIKQVYRDSGLVVSPGGELPDYLPMVLEFAVHDPERGRGLLQRFRAGVELIRLGLINDGLPHAGVLQAVCHRLPGESPQTHAEVQARFGQVQPVEFVGLDLGIRPVAQTETPALVSTGSTDRPAGGFER